MKRPRKTKPPATLLRPSTLKQNLLQKIKEHQTRNEETPSDKTKPNAGHNNNNNNNNNNNTNNPSNQDLANQFKMSTNYLEQLMHKKKEARKQNKKSMRSKTPSTSQPQPQPPQMQQMVQPPQMQQMVQPPQMQQMVQPPQMQQMAQMPQMVQPQVSLELPPELQINPIMMHPIIPHPQVIPPQIVPQVIPPQVVPPQVVPPQIVPPIVVPDQFQLESLDPLNAEPSKSDPPIESLPQNQNPNPNPTVVLRDVPYGCLRNGNKPTYRTYHRNRGGHHNTTVRAEPSNSSIVAHEVDVDPMIQERQRKLREIQENFQKSNTTIIADPEPTQIKNKIKQTITKKYKLGKTPGSNVVGVLIKNSDTRRRIQEEHGVLQRESIVDIRKYLHDHGLVKVGSDAPPDVLRNIYESAKMTGEISNTNKHVLLHNFIKSDDTPG
jgi:hypothetical protein